MDNTPAFLLTELQDLLEEQIRFARNGKTEEVSSLMARVDELLAEMSACHLPLHEHKKCERIQQLHDELRLMLTAQKSELSERFKKIHTGKNSLRAYRNASSPR